MKCPACQLTVESRDRSVIDTRSAGDASIRRRRRCPCGHRWTTYESIRRETPARATTITLRTLDVIKALADRAISQLNKVEP